MPIDLALRAAYALNIVILTPVVLAMVGPRAGPAMAAFEGKVGESPGLRLLVASLWFAIWVCSLVGVWLPRPLWPILLLQVIYKASYLLVFVWPLVRAEGIGAAPLGVSASFLLIVAVWPFLLAALWRAST